METKKVQKEKRRKAKAEVKERTLKKKEAERVNHKVNYRQQVR